MSNLLTKIGLGTAQWGLPYGISNQSGQTTPYEVPRILEFAKTSGIKVIDTARTYGQAEQVLGSNDLSGFKIITKIPVISDPHICKHDFDEGLELSFAKSLASMDVESIQGLLVHNCNDLFSLPGSAILRFLNKQKSLGKCRQIGVSVYNSLQIKKVLDLFIPDIIQLPFSVFDQRLLQDGTLSTLKSLGIEIHARSIFLQGLLLMKINDIPSYFRPWMAELSAWNKLCADLGSLPQHVALDYVISNNYIDKVIVGVENLSQLVDLVSSTGCSHNISSFKVLGVSDPGILNPGRWDLDN